MSTAWMLSIAVVAFCIVVIAVVERGPLRVWADHRLVLRRGHLITLAVALTLPACVAMIVSLAGRIKLDDEISDRARADAARLLDQQLTRAEVNAIAGRQARLEQPTQRELAIRSQLALEACARTLRCRMSFTRTVNRVLRVEGPRLVPAPTTPSPPRPIQPLPIQPSPPGRVGPRGPQGPAGPRGADGRDGADGRSVDSRIFDGLDNRIHDLERLSAGLLDAICSPALVRLLTAPLRICR